MAVGKDGGCIPGATFTVVSGQSYVGEVITQQTPCGVWDYGDVGIMLRRLTPGVAMTLRASAAGYLTVERTVFAHISGTSEIFVLRVGTEAGLVPTKNVVRVGTIALQLPLEPE